MHGLGLGALPARVEVPAPVRPGGADRGDLHELAQAVFERLAPLEVVEHGTRVGVLFLGPRDDLVGECAHLFGVGVVALEPAVGIHDLVAVKLLGDRVARGLGRLGDRGGGADEGGNQGGQGERDGLHTPTSMGSGVLVYTRILCGLLHASDHRSRRGRDAKNNRRPPWWVGRRGQTHHAGGWPCAGRVPLVIVSRTPGATGANAQKANVRSGVWIAGSGATVSACVA